MIKFLNIFIFVLIVSIFAISIALIVDDNILEGVILLLISLGLCVAEYVKYQTLKENKNCNKTGTFEGSFTEFDKHVFNIKYKSNCDRQTDLDKKKEVIYKKLKYENYGKFYFDQIEKNILNTIKYNKIKINTENDFYKIIKGNVPFNNEQNFTDFIEILEHKKIISGYEKDNIKTKLGNDELYNLVVNEIKQDDPILVYTVICICVRQDEVNEYKKETFQFLSEEDKMTLLSQEDKLKLLTKEDKIKLLSQDDTLSLLPPKDKLKLLLTEDILDYLKMKLN